MRHNPFLSLSLFGLHSQSVKNGLHVSSFVSFQALHLIISLFSHPSSSPFSSVLLFLFSSFSPSYTIHSILLFLQLTLTVHFAPSLSLSPFSLFPPINGSDVHSMFCKKHVLHDEDETEKTRNGREKMEDKKKGRKSTQWRKRRKRDEECWEQREEIIQLRGKKEMMSSRKCESIMLRKKEKE